MLPTLKRLIIAVCLVLVAQAALARPAASEQQTACGGCYGLGRPVAVEACTESGYICNMMDCGPPCACCACAH